MHYKVYLLLLSKVIPIGNHYHWVANAAIPANSAFESCEDILLVYNFKPWSWKNTPKIPFVTSVEQILDFSFKYFHFIFVFYVGTFQLGEEASSFMFRCNYRIFF